jgi:outer membrane protein OmpA-like peptidoglycan-associated protein/tetratricopeptide (TPR) repeat protein
MVFCGAAALQAQEQKSLPQLADEAFARQEYAVAARMYVRLAERKGKRAGLPLLEKIAQCYLGMARFSEAGYWYMQMMERPDCPSAILARYGEIQKSIGEYDTARLYIARFNPANADSVQWKQLMLAGCDSALQWEKEPLGLAVENLKELSSFGSDWSSGWMKGGLLVTSNGYRKMALSTGAERNPATDTRVNQPFFKAYLYKQYKKGSVDNNTLEEVAPELLGRVPYHIGPVCFSTHEDTIYATLNAQEKDMSNRKKKGPVNGERLMSIFWSVKKDSGWKPLEPVAELNYSGSSTGNPVLSGNGNILYFVSDRPGGQGKTDIWFSEKQSNGHWGPPVNCGPGINTRFEEAFPTINEEGVLYFSSKGYPGMGGFDIFRAVGSRTEWSTPRNLHTPFNSGADDLGFVVNGNRYEGYFASNRRGGGGGDDIYHFMDTHLAEKLEDPYTYTRPDRPVEPPKRENTDTSTAHVVPPPDKADSNVVEKLQQLRFYYDYNSAVLLTESMALLDRVAVVLRQYPNWKLMVRSYADSRGSDGYNMKLSALRCYAVINYLIKKGLSPRRLYYENLGERELVNPCGDGVPCDESRHRENRRSMLKIIY